MNKNEIEKLSPLQALREFFKDSARPLGMQELREVVGEDRRELGDLAKQQLLDDAI